MTPVFSPASLQHICQSTAASWLLDWSGIVGLISARTAALQSKGYSRTREDKSSTCSLNIRIPRNSQHEVSESIKDIQLQEKVFRKCESSYCRKKRRQDDKVKILDSATDIHLGNDISVESRTAPECQDHYVYGSDIGCNRKKNLTFTSLHSSSRISFDEEVLKESVRICSLFFRYHIPPTVINKIVSLAWKQLTRTVGFINHNQYTEQYQVTDWIKRVPAFLRLCSNLSVKNLGLDISGIPDNLMEDVLVIISQYFSLTTVNSFVLPKADFKIKHHGFSDKCKILCKDIVSRVSLTSLILNNDLCDDQMLSTISQVSLKELVIGGNSVSEKGIINGLCSLPAETVSEAQFIIMSGHMESLSASPLRKSLQKLEMSFQRLHSSVFHLIPAIFAELQYYDPHRNMVQCLQNFERLMNVENNLNTSISSQLTTNLVRVNAGRSTRAILNQVAGLCPHLKELVLILESDAEETLVTLEQFHKLSHTEILYFPPLPTSPPKLDASILQTLFHTFKSQLRVISLTGFNISGRLLTQLSQLPELCQLSFTDCWLSSPRNLPNNLFPSLDKLKLNFLPANSTMQFLTMGGNVHTLHLDLNALEWVSSPFTDSSLRALVSVGIFESLHTFTASSPYLTGEALSILASLPNMKVVGYLASWGLTEEELCCVNHSGPQHLVCYL